MLKIKKFKLVHFYLVSILIILMPLIRESNFLLFGERVSGTVIEIVRIGGGSGIEKSGYVFCSVIEYQNQEKLYQVLGPENMEFDIGREFPLIIHPRKKDKVIIASFSGIYLQKKTSFTLIVLMIWFAIFTTLRQMQNLKNRPK